MVGAIIGDIVGSRFERHNHKSTDFELFTDKCSFTDDTAMTLAVAKALLESNGDPSLLSANTVKCMQEIGRKYPNCGYGHMFRLWLHNQNPKPYNSLVQKCINLQVIFLWTKVPRSGIMERKRKE